MRKTIPLLTLLLATTGAIAADKPGPFASADTKLDYLLETWKGRSLADLRSVWGRQSAITPRGQYQAYVYEQTKRVRTGISIFGEVSISTGPITCTAYFEVDGEENIVRVTRSGGGKECWNAFKSYAPPD